MDINKYKYVIMILVLGAVFVLVRKYLYTTKPLNLDNFVVEQPKIANIKPSLTLYFIDGCMWCQKFKPTWKELKNKNIPNIDLISVDCDKNPNDCVNVPGYPYIIFEKNGVKTNYTGDRTLEDLIKFINNKKNT